jgi:Uri superfamily endonuclease
VKSAISYQLTISVARPLRLRIGRLGRFLFPAGRYVYTGSAKRNFEARIARHLRKEKPLRWHIDWLLAAPGVAVVSVKRSGASECALNQKIAGAIVAPGFGASDCRSGCGSHLRYRGASRSLSA